MNDSDIDITCLSDEISVDQQLKDWAAGNTYHNNGRYIRFTNRSGVVVEIKKMEGGECCPDFSCCMPDLAWPLEERQRFLTADQKTRQEMLGMSLSALIAEISPNVPVFLLSDNAGAQDITGTSQVKH